MSLQTAAKRGVEKLLRLGAAPARMAGRSLILAYHNVVADEDRGFGDSSLHLPLTTLARQLDLLESHCLVLPLTDVLAGRASPGRPHVAITFDDAYRGAVELAMPELARRGLPSTLFVAPGLLGQRSFWWDELAGDTGGLDVAVRKRALEVEQGRNDRIRQGTGREELVRALPASFGGADEGQVRDLHRHGPVTLAAHSWSHPNLTAIDAAALDDEMSRPMAWLRALKGPTLPFVAYPYGLSSPAVAATAERSGYTGGLLVDGGWFKGIPRPWCIPRYNVPAGLSEDGFMLRLSGVVDPPSPSQSW